MADRKSAASDDAGSATVRRPHTGRRRNEEARQAILNATIDLLAGAEAGTVTVEAIASQAGVGKQTIYRWWPNRAALVAEALTEGARDRVPDLDSGDVRRDLQQFLVSTFRAVSKPAVTQALRAMMADAIHDTQAAQVLREYTATRRSALEAVIRRGIDQGQLRADADVALILEQTFGFLWYRLLMGHAPLNRKAALSLAENVLRQLGAPTNIPIGDRTKT